MIKNIIAINVIPSLPRRATCSHPLQPPRVLVTFKCCLPWQESVRGAVALQTVQFHYPSRPTVTVLKDMSMEIEAGKTIALVGSSGCGKSTIIQLLERFYDPSHGSLVSTDTGVMLL